MNRLKLLFVEDENDIRDVVGVALSLDQQIEVTAFDSGREALAAINARGEVYHFALLNLRLPMMSGIELHERLRAIPGMGDLRSILITAALRDLDIASLAEKGIAGIIAKPFDPLTLASDIRALFEEHAEGSEATIVTKA